MSLKASQTLENLIKSFALEAQANRRYLYFAQKADMEGYNDIAAVFRSTAEVEATHTSAILAILEKEGDPVTKWPIGSTEQNLKSSISGKTGDNTEIYPQMAETARKEGFDDIAELFEALAKAEKIHAGRFRKALESLVA